MYCQRFFFITFLLLNIYLCASQKESIDCHIVDKNEISSLGDSNKRYVIDEIQAIVHGPARTRVFCLSDRERLALGSGQPIEGNPQQAFDRMMFDELAYQDAVYKKVPLDDGVMQAYIEGIMRQNKWNLADMERIFKSSGFETYQEGLEQMRVLYGSNAMMEMKKQSLIVSQEEVIAYFEKNPVLESAQIKLQIGFVPFSPTISVQDLCSDLKNRIGRGVGDSLITWKAPCWVSQDDLAESLSFLLNEPLNEISAPQEVRGGFEMYKVLKKKEAALVPLARRYRQIVDTLIRPKFNQIMNTYKQLLFDSASVVFFTIPESA